MAGLFDTFTVAKRGLNVQQGAINTTSHNIANANTTGYSRQRVVIETTRPFGGMSKFDSAGPGQVGTGAHITSIMRIRDKFIDYQVRNETSKLGNYQVTSQFLSQVEDIFGEPSDTGIQTQFSEFYAAFQELAKTPDKSSARTVALQKASALADSLNHAYSQLEKKVTDAQELLQQNVTDINSMLNQINELNQQISDVCAVGQTPNDLLDRRDNLLDQLSSMFGIEIENKNRETINLKVEGFPNKDTKIDNLVNSDPNTEYTRFSYVKGVQYPENADGSLDKTKLEIEYYPLGDSNAEPKKITITADTADGSPSLEDIKSSLEQNRIL
ncbi:MAG: flagellar hook-associated protein FlgK, partial [Clostridium sp.]|nr:flagellar hook-associated protein FlgK [Clostridium sp.]